MKKTSITNSDINQILNDKIKPKHWELMLGIGLQYEYASDNVSFSAPYPQMGEELWKAIRYEIWTLLCDKDSNEPQEWLNEFLTGDIRNLLVGICSAITAKYDVTLGIALPAAALVFKSGIIEYCSKHPRRRHKRTVSQILDSKKSKFRNQSADKRKIDKRHKKK